MTGPNQGSSPGFEQGDDFVAARISIDIPTEGVAGLREITQEVDRYRTAVEAANRAADTFTNYLTRMAEAASQAATAEQNLIGQLDKHSGSMNQAAVSGQGGPQPQLNVPPQYNSPFAAESLGMGTDRSSIGTPEASAQMDQLRQSSPREYINKMAASGHYRPGDIPASSPNQEQVKESADRIAQRSQQQQGGGGLEGLGEAGAFGSDLLSELRPGAGNLGMLALAQRGLGKLSGMGGGAGGGIAAKLGMGLGRMGPVGTAGLALGAVGTAAYLGQAGGEIYQDYKNMGSMRGGGATEGMGYEMNIRSMAMNPFISTDQARQIVQQGLREGYTGKEFDTMTSFVSHNLKEMNMDINESFGLVKKNVKEGGMTLEGLGTTLAQLKEASKTGYSSLPDLMSSYEGTSSALINAGISGPVASGVAAIGAQTFPDSQVSKGTGGDIAAAMMSSPTGVQMMRTMGGLEVPAGVSHMELPYMFEGEEGSKAAAIASSNVLKNYAKRMLSQYRNPPPGSPMWLRARELWFKKIKSLGVPLSKNQAFEWFAAYSEGKDPMAEGVTKSDRSAKAAITPSKKPLWESVAEDVGQTAFSPFVEAFSGAKMVASMGADALTGNWQGMGHYTEKYDGDIQRAGLNNDPYGYQMPVLDSIESAYGRGGYEVLDQNGKPMKFDRSNKQHVEAFSRGDYTFREKGSSGPGRTAESVANSSPDQIKGVTQTQVTGQVTIGLTPEATRALQVQGGSTITLTPHEQQANSGYGSAQPNNAPPGYDMPR